MLFREGEPCGYIQPSASFRVYGGEPAGEKYWPWLASVRILDPTYDNESDCSGILIHKNFVLTAAHCVLDLDSGSELRLTSDWPVSVSLGVRDKPFSSFDFDRSVAEVLFHPQLLQQYLINRNRSGNSSSTQWGSNKFYKLTFSLSNIFQNLNN